jgi:hypothetical protein
VYGVSRDEVVMDADGCVCVYIGVEGAYVLDGHVFTGDIVITRVAGIREWDSCDNVDESIVFTSWVQERAGVVVSTGGSMYSTDGDNKFPWVLENIIIGTYVIVVRMILSCQIQYC